ncbi:hypothetical protein NLJ89_g8148 [Agrocybe chaxingu]|uniref:Laccase n=1 Tax=Agrocybe chaxingu TaxID=84603 RepID=A0A9W8JVA0_9AGAR|nr:hypothetical protein NLJ89_g8148 [Agrocybe chaxingu]
MPPMSTLLGALVSAFSLLPTALAALRPDATLNIVNKAISPDGFNRSAVLVQGSHPAPLIKATKGDKFRLNVVNKLNDDTMLRSTSIHWHGLFQRGTTWADGPVGVNQCPIAPNRSFLYQFSAGDQAGTFWYHSHFGTQYCDGLRGPLVVYDPGDPHTKSLMTSTIITLSDWYHLPSPSVPIPALSDSTLINGKGRYVNGPKVDLAIVNVKRGRRYRFRLVSLSCDPNYMFSIDGHKLTVIEADSQSTQPLTVDRIQIFAGQRYSFVLEANQKVDNYWIRSLPNVGAPGLTSGFAGGINSAILRYDGAPKADPTSAQPANPKLLQEADLHPLTNPRAPGKPFPGGADEKYNFALGLNSDTGKFSMNGASFSDPPVPVLLQILSGVQNAQDLLPSGSVYPLKPNKVVEISIPGGLLGGPHPFHLHGHAFSVVRSAGANATYNYDNPVRRDVVSMGDQGSNVTIRFVTDNPGPWFLHCHIEFHLAAGLAVVFSEDTGAIEFKNPTPAAWDQLCPIYERLPASATSVRIVPTSTPNATLPAP